jgi:hypothetical protein
MVSGHFHAAAERVLLAEQAVTAAGMALVLEPASAREPGELQVRAFELEPV